MFLIPNIKVLVNPSPSKGYILAVEKFFKLLTNRKNILIKTKGIIMKFVFTLALYSKLQIKIILAINIAIIYSTFVLGKYTIFKLSQKFLSNMLVVNEK